MERETDQTKPGTATPAVGPDPKDRDAPGAGDRERLDRSEREAFEGDAMRERDA
jgi:hypothetical protein